LKPGAAGVPPKVGVAPDIEDEVVKAPRFDVREVPELDDANWLDVAGDKEVAKEELSGNSGAAAPNTDVGGVGAVDADVGKAAEPKGFGEVVRLENAPEVGFFPVELANGDWLEVGKEEPASVKGDERVAGGFGWPVVAAGKADTVVLSGVRPKTEVEG
jgi:hypothetical protein